MNPWTSLNMTHYRWLAACVSHRKRQSELIKRSWSTDVKRSGSAPAESFRNNAGSPDCFDIKWMQYELLSNSVCRFKMEDWCVCFELLWRQGGFGPVVLSPEKPPSGIGEDSAGLGSHHAIRVSLIRRFAGLGATWSKWWWWKAIAYCQGRWASASLAYSSLAPQGFFFVSKIIITLLVVERGKYSQTCRKCHRKATAAFATRPLPC